MSTHPETSSGGRGDFGRGLPRIFDLAMPALLTRMRNLSNFSTFLPAEGTSYVLLNVVLGSCKPQPGNPLFSHPV